MSVELSTPIKGPRRDRRALRRDRTGSRLSANKERSQSVTVYLRRESDWKVVGIEREGANRWEPR